ncbi:hypothetical protein [Croceibacterium ferulae]|uniref:hypothetical protein n=1 Tax=Croceibacterium ferulae TaxID=1854641 RepID=UPI0015880E49|nr:hypothetical protein [Croceibacterium ferulae]
MADDQKFPTQASGGGSDKGKPDGVSASPSNNPDVDVQGRTSGGESDGGAYPNPHTGREPTQGGFMGHGGQTNIGYHGSGQTGSGGPEAPNSTTRGDDEDSDREQVDQKDGGAGDRQGPTP